MIINPNIIMKGLVFILLYLNIMINNGGIIKYEYIISI